MSDEQSNRQPADSELYESLKKGGEQSPSLIKNCACIDHVAVAVTDINEAIEWYQLALGFDLIERRLTSGSATSMVSAVMRSGSAVVVLIQGTTPESQVSRFIENFGPGVQHLAFCVDDLQATLDQVKAAGGAADVEVIEDEGIRQVFLRRDSGSGVRIELIEKRGGDFTDASVTKLFRAFEKNNLY